MPRFTFPKEEKLKSKKLIETLFTQGEAVTQYPLKLIYTSCELPKEVKVQAAISVPKRNFKLAVKRNRIKRLIREAYRLNKPLIFNKIETPHAFMFLYLAKEEPDFQQLNETMQRLLHKFLKHTHHEAENG